MDLTRYVEELRQQLTTAAELGGDDAVALAHKLATQLDGTVRLVLFDALSAAADEITTDLAPGSVSVRLRGRDPEFDVVPPPSELTSTDVIHGAAVPPTAQQSESWAEVDGGLLDPGLHVLGQTKRDAGDLAAVDLGPRFGLLCRRRNGRTVDDVT